MTALHIRIAVEEDRHRISIDNFARKDATESEVLIANTLEKVLFDLLEPTRIGEATIIPRRGEGGNE